jgi:two-component system response regulator AtoC
MAIEGRGRTVIIWDDCPEDRNYLESIMQTQGYVVRLAQDTKEVLSYLRSDKEVSLVLLDGKMPRGLEALCELRRRRYGLQVVLTSEIPVSQFVRATIEDQGAKLLEKPFLPEDLLCLVESPPPGDSTQAHKPVLVQRGGARTVQPYMVKIEGLIERVGSTDVPVLLQGETGVGKEVLARQIHSSSSRASNQFVKINCAALPTELIESELFGYERGAFSGAFQQCQGLFETAHEGTIFLDEIGDMEVRLQAKLLQVLQDGEFRRLGGRSLIKVDVRVMAATHQDLSKAVQEGRFREDLYYRLNVVSIKIPPLRERCTEILPLANFFLQKYAKGECLPPAIPSVLLEAMLEYDWPGNVRELENAMRRFLIIRNPHLLADEFRSVPSRGRSSAPAANLAGDALPEEGGLDESGLLVRAERMKRRAEHEAVLSTLKATHWNRKRAAERLGIDYKALLYKMKKLGIGPERSGHSQSAVAERKSDAALAAGWS